MIKAVIFDMDGLIIDTEKLLLKYWLEAAAYYGYPMTKDNVLGIRSLAAKYAAPKLKREVCEDFDYDKVRALRRKLMEEYIEKNGVEEKKGLGELLEYLKGKNYLIAVATATDLPRTTKYLKSINRFEAFDKIVCATMVENGKPEPDIYLEAARQIGVEPKDCIALEDSPNGITAAYKAGMHAIMVPDLSQPDEETREKCEFCVENLAKVIPILEQNLIH